MKAPAFQLYPQDFISSLDVQLMSAAEVGAYCLLLFNSWTQPRQGFLPNDEAQLRHLSRLSSEEWKLSKKKLLAKFPTSEDKKHRYNPRLLVEAEKQAAFREKQAEHGKLGGRPKREEKPDKAKGFLGESQKNPTLSQALGKPNPACAPSSSSTSFTTEIEQPMSDSATPSPDGAGFEVFWNAYGRKEGAKGKMAKQWNGLKLATRLTILNGLSTYKQAKTVNGPQYLPMPQTFINGKLWEAETYGTAPAIGQYQPAAMLDPETDRLRAFTEEQAALPAPMMVYRSAPNRPAQQQPVGQTAQPRA